MIEPINSAAMQTHADGFVAAMRDRAATCTFDPNPSMRKPHHTDAIDGNVSNDLAKTFQHFFNDDDTTVKITRYWDNEVAVGLRVGGLTPYENVMVLQWLLGRVKKPPYLHDDL